MATFAHYRILVVSIEVRNVVMSHKAATKVEEVERDGWLGMNDDGSVSWDIQTLDKMYT